MKSIGRILGIGVALVIVVPLAIGGVVLATFDPNTYKTQITDALTKQLGRTVALDGKLALGLSWAHGLSLSANDIKIANPSWASRTEMATIGQAELGLNLQALLAKRVQITAFKLNQADIQLETSASGQNNWDFAAATKAAANEKMAATPASEANKAQQPVSLQVDEVSIVQSKIAIRAKDGKATVVVIDRLELSDSGQSAKIDFAGNVGGQAVAVKLSGDALQKLVVATWPFDAVVNYGAFTLTAKGTFENAAQQLTLSRYQVAAGSSVLNGDMVVGLGGARPMLRGTIKGEKINPNDFAVAPAETAKQQADHTNAAPAGGSQRLFSTDPLPLDGLKAVDARLEIAIGEVTLPTAALTQLATRLDLANGRLLLSPLNFMLAGSKVEGQFKLDGSGSPAQLGSIIKATQLNLGSLLPPPAASSFAMKADIDSDITASGNSMHALASSASGTLNMVMAGDTQTSGAMTGFVRDILSAAVPGAGDLLRAEMNCIAARFNLANGLMRSNGLLIDTSQATLAGQGDINLQNETINMVMNVRTKAIDVSQYTPALRITGPLLKPSLAPDRASVAGKLAGALLGGDFGGGASAVPDMQVAAGQNACLYTLQNPKAAAASSTGQAKKPQEQIKELGGKLLNNLFGN